MNHSLTPKQSFSSHQTQNRFNVASNSKVTYISSRREASRLADVTGTPSQEIEKSEHQYCVICSSILCRQINNGVSSWYCSRCHNILSDSLVQAFSNIQHDASEARDRFFKNHSSSIKIIQFDDVQTGHYESVVFPGQHVIFTISDDTAVNIKSGDHVTSLKADTILGKDFPSVDLMDEANTTPAA